jgi:hypothetical protein
MPPTQNKAQDCRCVRHQRLTPILLATQEAEIRRIEVQSQPRENSSRDPISKTKQNKAKQNITTKRVCLANLRP